MKRTFLLIFCIVVLSAMLSNCSGCSKSGRKSTKYAQSGNVENTSRQSSGQNIVKMEKQNGVYMIPVYINGIRMYFIFDTGASLISISSTEAMFLYKQGKLTAEDIKGTANFTDANGDVSEGTIIVLREVKIGDKILSNVEASVVNNLEAPILMGQSALEKFGKISIDYKKNEISFE